MPIAYALDALNFLSADVRNLFGPFINVYLVTGRGWTQTDVGLVSTGSGLLGIALQTPIGAAIDVTRAKRAVIVATMAAMSLAAVIIVLYPTFWPMALATGILSLAGDAFVPAVAAITLGLVTREALARRLGRNSAFDHGGNIVIALVAGGVGYLFSPAGRLPACARFRRADRRGGPVDTGGCDRSRPGPRSRQGRGRRRRRERTRHPFSDADARDFLRLRAPVPLRQCASAAARRTKARPAISEGGDRDAVVLHGRRPRRHAADRARGRVERGPVGPPADLPHRLRGAADPRRALYRVGQRLLASRRPVARRRGGQGSTRR